MSVAIIAIDKRGQKTDIEFQVIPGKNADSGGVAASQSENRLTVDEVEGINFGSYHAIIIGNNRYVNFPELTSARRDAEAVALLLRSRYKFKVTLLLDSTRSDIIKSISRAEEQLDSNSNLLIYYAGNGELAANQSRGHWLPVDAERDRPGTWLSNAQITALLESTKARHVMVVADSCYSGTMTPTSIVRTQAAMKKEWMQSLVKLKARMVLSSGGLEPVLDTGGGEHSVFAEAFIETLRENQWLLPGYDLWRDVHRRVRLSPEAAALDQNPQYAPIKNSGHQTGDFFFVPVI